MILYRLFDMNGKLLYVGLSTEFPRRLRAHRRDKSWWPQVAMITLEVFPTWLEVAKAEQRAIDTESPRFNLRSRPYFPAILSPTVRGKRLTGEEMTREQARAEAAAREVLAAR